MPIYFSANNFSHFPNSTFSPATQWPRQFPKLLLLVFPNTLFPLPGNKSPLQNCWLPLTFKTKTKFSFLNPKSDLDLTLTSSKH